MIEITVTVLKNIIHKCQSDDDTMALTRASSWEQSDNQSKDRL